MIEQEIQTQIPEHEWSLYSIRFISCFKAYNSLQADPEEPEPQIFTGPNVFP